jgi:hypothetical protein
MRLPVTVTPPKNTSKASATTVVKRARGKPVMYSPIPTRVAASAPNAWLSAMRCGIAVIRIGVLANVRICSYMIYIKPVVDKLARADNHGWLHLRLDQPGTISRAVPSVPEP